MSAQSPIGAERVGGATMLERNSGEDDQTILEAPNETLRLRSPVRQEPPRADRPSWQPPAEADDEHRPQHRNEGDEVRQSWFRRHPIAVAFGLLCLVLAIPAGYLYWDYIRHFESTDDAYIAA